MPALRALAIILLLSRLLGCSLGASSSVAEGDTPQRATDGRVEQTIGTSAPWATDTERLALIHQIQKRRLGLLAQYPPPATLAKRAPQGAINVDGRLDEPAWRNAPIVTDFKNTRSGTPARFQTRARLLWDDRYLYVGYECEDTDVTAHVTQHDGDIWNEDAVEIFIDANGDEMSYVEIEANPLNTLYDAAVADYRAEADWGDPLNERHLDMPRAVRSFRCRDTRAASSIEGTLNHSRDVDKGWTCELAISWTDIARGTNTVRVPPRDGDQWRVSLTRINVKSKENADEFAAWNPSGAWFHVPWCFGRVIFVK